MKSDKEIKGMIKKCKELRKYIAHFSFFGTNNWLELDTQAKILETCIGKSVGVIKDRLDTRLEIAGDDWSEDQECKVYDWVLGNVEDPPVSDEDIETFKESYEKKHQKDKKGK